MDFATHFLVLHSSPLGRNPSLSPVSPKGLVFGSGDHGDIIDHLERVTVENTDHLCMDDTDGPTAKQIKSLNAEIQYLPGKEELDGVDSVLVESAPLDSPDLPEVVMPIKRGWGRGKGKVDPPIPKKGVGGGTKQ
ncbi:hypothetical protein RHMOL_Rhmol01G0068400 [Rhododendron molle]|uniref:Uncharacterized protein n=1 Tax=Rhododendron molle TaxID=49168 RepID=A0ACC0PZC8_RHOML|nr:hypothetical protein RHMOL_Rhmol01G0068400 [Rhododendron molle]